MQNSPMVDYTEKRKTKRNKGKYPKSNFMRIYIKVSFHKEKKVWIPIRNYLY